MYKKTQTIKYDISSGQTYDFATQGNRIVRLQGIIKLAGGANTNSISRINGLSSNLTYEYLSGNGVTPTAGAGSANGLCINNGLLKVDMEFCTFNNGHRRVHSFRNVAVDAAGALTTSHFGEAIWNDTSTAITSIGIDLGSGMAFAAGSYLILTRIA